MEEEKPIHDSAEPAGAFREEGLWSRQPPPVVVGFDGSQSSEHALAYGAGLARRQHTRLVVVYVRSTGTMLPSGFGALDVLPDAIADSDLTDQVGEILGDGSEPNAISWELLERIGTPDRELMSVADELRADAIVVGRSGSPLHRLIGSVAGRMVRRCDQPVIVVP